MVKVEAFLVAEHINIKRFKADFMGTPVSISNFELFYAEGNDKFLHVFHYGVVAFAGYNDVEKSNVLKFLRTYSTHMLEGSFKEDLNIYINPDRKLTFSYNSLTVRELDENLVRIVMLNIAQSVLMDFYEVLANDILGGTKKFTEELAVYGKIRISKKNLLKFIGRTLSVKNSIFDNLYIFNSPEITWENPYLEKVDKGMKDTFDINLRFRELDYELKIVEDNLKLFTDLLQNRESTRLEWIIITLILIEVLNLFFDKLL